MSAPDSELEDIRREIDAIDDGLMTLLQRRFVASEHVRVIKSKTGALAGSPFRPAREAAIMRRLLTRSGGLLPAELMVRLWRVILTGSTLSQAPVTIHVQAAELIHRQPHAHPRLFWHHSGRGIS
jgi:chorismate mutase